MTTTPTNTTVTALHECRDQLLNAVLNAAYCVPQLTGARAARARELVDMLDAAVSYCERLATVVEGDARAEATTR